MPKINIVFCILEFIAVGSCFDALGINQTRADLIKESVATSEQNGIARATLNNAGYQRNDLDEFGKLFVNYSGSCGGRPVLDLGVAFGYTSKRLLQTGATVVANDLSPEMLQDLNFSISSEERNRLAFRPGNVMDLEFADSSFCGIWANRFFHFLKPAEIRILLTKLFGWLQSGGKICITAASPFFPECDLLEYDRKKSLGEQWPGYQEADYGMFLPFMHFLDPEVLKREMKRAGFYVEKCAFIHRQHGTTSVGVIALKLPTEKIA